MNLDMNRIKRLLADQEAKRCQIAEIAKAQQNRAVELALLQEEQTKANKELQVNKIISELQYRIEFGIEHNQFHRRLLSLRSEELLHKPRRAGGLFTSDLIKVRDRFGSRKISRGFKPDCLPDYARQLFDYCTAQGLTTLLREDSDYSLIGTPNEDRWKWASYVIEIYW